MNMFVTCLRCVCAFFVLFPCAFVRFSLTYAIFFMWIFVVTGYFCGSSVFFICLAECGYLIDYVQHVCCYIVFFWVVQCVMESSVRFGRIVVNTDRYVIVSSVGFNASETYCVVVFLLQFVLDLMCKFCSWSLSWAVVVLPSRVIKMSSTYVFYVSALSLSLSLSLSLVGVVLLFFQDLQEEFCLYAGCRGANQCSVILRPTFACFEVVLLHGEF